MLSQFTGLLYAKGMGHAAERPSWAVWRVIPVTLAVTLGPLVTVVYRLTRPTGTAVGSFSLAQAVRGLFCVLMVVSLFPSPGLRLLQHRCVRPLLFLAIYALITSWTVSYPHENMVFAVRMAFLVLIFACAFHLAEKGLLEERWLLICAWVILLVMMANIEIGLVTGRTVRVYGSRYATAGVIGSVFVTSFLVLSTLPVFVRLAPRDGSAVMGLVLLFVSLFFTMCRTALIAATAALGSSLLIYVSCLGRRIPWRKILVLAGVLLLVTGLGLCTRAGADLRERFRDLNPFEGTGSGRYLFWQVSLGHIVNRPMDAQLLGEGMGRVRDVMGQNWGHPIVSHNDWLDFANAFGLFGLIGISWWYFELVRFAWRLRDRKDGPFQGACAGAILLGLISIGTGGFYDPAWALTYAALGFWAGRAGYERRCSHAGCPVH